MPTSPVGRPAASRIEREQERRRRLAVRARHARDLEGAGRLAEERIRRDGHRGARVLHEQLRHVELERTLDDERRGPGGHRLGRELVPVRARAGHAEEERAAA